MNRILMPPLPLPKLLLRNLSALLPTPPQHLRAKLHPHALAVPRNHTRRVIQQVVRVNDTDLNAPVPLLATTNLPDVSQVVEQPPQLAVADLGRQVGRPAGDGGERRDRAAVVGRDAVARMADQEGPVEAGEEGGGHDGGVAGLGVRGRGAVGGGAVGGGTVDAVRVFQ